MKLFIKNMVCPRCILAVKTEFEKLGLQYLDIDLGEVTLVNNISKEEKAKLKKALEQIGFELLDDENSIVISKIKSVLIDLIHNKNNDITIPLSVYLVQILHQDYSKISNLFSLTEGISIEKYFINLKIEKVKELMVYDELSLSEIANLLNYSSVSHLSHQFKKVTGFSPSYFKTIKENKRTAIDQF